VLWLIAVLSTITVIHRTVHTWKQTQILEAEAQQAGQAA